MQEQYYIQCLLVISLLIQICNKYIYLKIYSLAKLIYLITKGEYNIDTKVPWPSISNEAKDLIKKLLEVDPKNRLTATQIISHCWLNK